MDTAIIEAAKFSLANPPGTPVIVITPEGKRLACGSIITSKAWAEGHKTLVWCQGFRLPQRLDRLSPVHSVSA